MTTGNRVSLTSRAARLAGVALCTVMVGCGASKTATVDDTGSTVGEATVASVATTVESTTTTSESVPSDDTTTTTEAAAPPDESTTTLPPGATPGLDDYDGNGEPDPTCSTQDFGAGLVLRIPCEIRSANDPENGTSLVAGSLYRLPGTDFPEFDNVSASAIQARDADGGKVVVIFFNSDALFTINSAELGGDATTVSLNAAVAVVQNHFPNADVQVRGHTDAQGSAASNQKLSEQRAAAVKGYFLSHGLDPAHVSNVGFASTRPVVAETNPDGSANAAAQAFNRRVEIVIHAGP